MKIYQNKLEQLLEKHNVKLDPETKHFYEDFEVDDKTFISRTDDQIIATNAHALHRTDWLFIELATGKCSICAQWGGI